MSSDQLLLGLDIGTQAVKGVLVRRDGRVVARATVERGPALPRPRWVEMDAERDWWGVGVRVIRKLLAGLDISPRGGRPADGQPPTIAAVGVCGLVPCLCVLDEAGHPLRPAILYSDNRALEELAWVNRRAGLSLTAEAVVPKLIWLREREPEVYARARTVLSAHNYVVYRLTGQRAMDYDTASIMGGVFDVTRRAWDADLCEQLGLPLGLWPTFSPATEVVGQVAEEAARATGLAPGTPVIAGTGDTFPTIVGSGAIDPGDAMIAFGTTGLLTVTRFPLVKSAGGPHFQGSGDEAAVIWGANVLSAGRLTRWYRDAFGHAEDAVAARMGEDAAFSLLEAEARRVPPGAEGLIVLPHWLGRRTPTPDATMRGAILGLSPSHTGAHVYRAILESFAFNVRQGFDALRPQIRRVVATAGGARSTLWRQILADVLQTPLVYYPEAGGAFGIAFIAGYAVGLIEDFGAIKAHWLHNPQFTEPDPEAASVYRRLFPVYCAFDTALDAPFAQLAATEVAS